MGEESRRINHGGGVIGVESWMRNHGEGNAENHGEGMEEEAERRNHEAGNRKEGPRIEE